jgi:CDP-glycerol glycerophosphotransferase (TagB/SpsB family)
MGYSSKYLDFLLLDRQVMFLPYDLEYYKEARGFMVDDFDKWTPGPKPRTFEEVLKDIVDGKDDYRPERKRINGLVNAVQTDNTPKKVFKFLKKRIAEL